MFVLSRLSLLCRLPPSTWSLPLPEAILSVLNGKFANTVLHNVGLIVSVWDIVSIGDSYLFPGDGANHVKVVFRY